MTKIISVSGKRKRAIASATVQEGKGSVRINRHPLESYPYPIQMHRIEEALILAGDLSKAVDINVTVRGGGFSSQAEAVRLSIAKGLVQFSKDKSLKDSYLAYDRHLLVADVRRKEPRKPNRHSKARAKVQKSYR